MRPENLTIEHIAKVMKRTVREVIELADNLRIAFAKPKLRPVDGKMRLITAPRHDWKMPYQWLGQFLRREFPLHPAAHGSVPGRSPFTAAARHLGPRNLLCRDVKDAFPSVTADRFYLEMLAHGFKRDIAQFLTKLLLPDGYLPQGGPASNAALDLFFYRVDCDISRELALLAARYTRFTDGLDASFRRTRFATEVGTIIERNLARLGLRINARKLDKCGWQPLHTERILCGVCVNSPQGTQFPADVLTRIAADCEGLLRGAHSVAPHTLTGLARRRRKLQGYLNQMSQADISPVRELHRRLKYADYIICRELKKRRILVNREWYTKGKNFDEAAELSERWRRRRSGIASSSRAPALPGSRGGVGGLGELAAEETEGLKAEALSAE